VALQSLEGQWLLLSSKHRVVCWNEVVHYGAAKLLVSVWRWCTWFDKFLMMEVYSNSLEVRVGVFPKRKSKFALRSREAPVNPSIKHRENFTYHVWQCTEYSTSSCICLHKKCRLHRNWSRMTSQSD
jgi:hypothetical protein